MSRLLLLLCLAGLAIGCRPRPLKAGPAPPSWQLKEPLAVRAAKPPVVAPVQTYEECVAAGVAELTKESLSERSEAVGWTVIERLLQGAHLQRLRLMRGDREVDLVLVDGTDRESGIDAVDTADGGHVVAQTGSQAVHLLFLQMPKEDAEFALAEVLGCTGLEGAPTLLAEGERRSKAVAAASGAAGLGQVRAMVTAKGEPARWATHAELQGGGVADEMESTAVELAPAMFPVQKGFYDWSGACVGIGDFYKSACANLDTRFEEAECRKGRQAELKKKPLFYLGNVRRFVSYDERRNKFKIAVPALLVADVEVDDCWSEGCVSAIISTKPYKLAGGKANFAKWSARYGKSWEPHVKTFQSFVVAGGSVPQPRSFENDIVVEALVEVVDSDVAQVGDWFWVDSLRVRVVALRASVAGLSWARVIKRGPRQLPECPLE
jgi:hypothetical protein